MLKKKMFPRRVATSTPLHRWCIPTSEVYAATCDQMKKGALADEDNSLCIQTMREPVKKVNVDERNPVTILLVDNFGM